MPDARQTEQHTGRHRGQEQQGVDINKLISALGVPPEKAPEAVSLLEQLVGQQAEQKAREFVQKQRRREESPYKASEEGLAKDIIKDADVNLIRNDDIRKSISTLLKTAEKGIDQIDPSELNVMLGQLQGYLEKARTEDHGSVPVIEKMMDNLMEITKTFSMSHNELGAISLSLIGSEIEQITSGYDGARDALENWVSQIEKTNYSAEADSNRSFFHSYSATIGWLPILARKFYAGIVVNGERITDRRRIQSEVDKLIKEYRMRIHTHNMKWAIEQTDWKIVQAMANEYSSAALFESFRPKNVTTAFNLCQRYFDRYRFAYGKVSDEKDPEGNIKKKKGEVGVALWRITPEAVAKIKEDVIKDLFDNYETYGINPKKPEGKQITSQEEKRLIIDEAERVTNIGMNLFSASMREGVHVARGQIARAAMDQIPGYRELTKEPAYQSDPNELLANLYNPLQFKIEKWTSMGEPQKAIFNKILLFLGKGDMVKGRQEFNNLLAIGDYFSSGWRIDNIYDATRVRIERFAQAGETPEQRKVRLESLSTGLMLQNKNPFRDDPKPDIRAEKLKDGKKWLRQVGRYRPLELIKAFAVTIDPDGKKYTTGEIQDKFQAMLKNGEFGTGIDNYVKLEEVLARYLNPIYEKAMQADWKTLHGIDIGNAAPDSDDYKTIKEVVDKVNRRIDDSGKPKEKVEKLTVESLQTIYKKLQDFLLEDKTVDDLATNGNHSHLYHRALYMDDAPLGKLEERIKEENREEIIPISEKLFTSEGGRRDPVARMWGDTSSAAMVSEAGMSAMFARDPESLLKNLTEAMGAQTGYAGRPPYLKFLYGIAGGWLSLSKADPIWQFLGLHNKIPIKTSEFERLFGLAAPSMSAQELRQTYDKIKLVLGQTDEEAGGKDLDKRIIKELGIEGYKIALFTFSKMALLIIIFMLQKQLEEMGKEEE